MRRRRAARLRGGRRSRRRRSASAPRRRTAPALRPGHVSRGRRPAWVGAYDVGGQVRGAARATPSAPTTPPPFTLFDADRRLDGGAGADLRAGDGRHAARWPWRCRGSSRRRRWRCRSPAMPEAPAPALRRRARSTQYVVDVSALVAAVRRARLGPRGAAVRRRRRRLPAPTARRARAGRDRHAVPRRRRAALLAARRRRAPARPRAARRRPLRVAHAAAWPSRTARAASRRLGAGLLRVLRPMTGAGPRRRRGAQAVRRR